MIQSDVTLRPRDSGRRRSTVLCHRLPVLVLALCSLLPLGAQGARPVTVPPAPLSIAMGEIQIISDAGVGTDPALQKLVQTSRDFLAQDPSASVILATGSRAPGGVVNIRALDNADSPMLMLEIQKNGVSIQKNFFRPWRAVSAETLAGAFTWLAHAADGFSRFPTGTPPRIVDRIDTSQYAPLDIQVMTPLPYGVATRPNGNLLLGFMGIITEVDPHGRLVGHWGKGLAADRNYNFAFEVRTSPSGTVVSKGSGGGEVYSFVNPDDAPRRTSTQISTSGEFIVLSDGSAVVKDAMTNQTTRFEGRRRFSLNLGASPTYPYFLMAAGPDATIHVYDIYSGEVRDYDKDGKLLASRMAYLPPDKVSMVRKFLAYPDGSLLFAGMDFLLRTNPRGEPLWYIDKARDAEIGDNTMISSLAFDPVTASIYLVRNQSKDVLRIIDPAWAADNGIDTASWEAMAAANRNLATDPADWDAWETKARWYEDHGATDLAIAALTQLHQIDPSDQSVKVRLDALQAAKHLAAAEALRVRVLDTMARIGPESARADYQNTLRLYEQTLRFAPGNRTALASRAALQEAMKRAEEGFTLPPEPPLNIMALQVEPIFPALGARYRTSPFGTLTLKNDGSSPVSAASATLYLPRFMDFPAELALPATINPGQEVRIPLTALFNGEVLTVEEDLPIQFRVEVIHGTGAARTQASRTAFSTLYRRTAMTWDESGKLAAFITPNEETIAAFALGALGRQDPATAPGPGINHFNRRIWRAALIADTLGAYGINYLEDPQSPFAGNTTKAIIDTVRFPRATLHYRNGDCDDTTALLASLYEAAGIPTAIMTSPGHVFLAFDTGEPASNRWLFGDPTQGRTLVVDERIWMPVETTILQKGFVTAWESAAGLVARHGPAQELEILPVARQWATWAPLPLPRSPYQISLPPTSLVSPLQAQSAAGLDKALYQGLVQDLERSLPATGRTRLAALNRLGIVHSRFARHEAAIRSFQQALDLDRTYLPAWINLGNAHLSAGRPDEAKKAMEQALAVRGDYAPARELLARIQGGSATVASTAPATGGERASEAAQGPALWWVED